MWHGQPTCAGSVYYKYWSRPLQRGSTKRNIIVCMSLSNSTHSANHQRMLTSCGYHSQGNAESPRDTEITPCGLAIAIMGNACSMHICKISVCKAGEVHEQQFLCCNAKTSGDWSMSLVDNYWQHMGVFNRRLTFRTKPPRINHTIRILNRLNESSSDNNFNSKKGYWLSKMTNEKVKGDAVGSHYISPHNTI